MAVDQSIDQSKEGVSSSTKMHATIGSLIIVLLTLLQLKSENKNRTPFETHGLIMKLFIVSMLIYALVAVAATKIQDWFTNHSLVLVLNQICIAAGVLACDFLLLILAPPFGYFLLVIWVLVLLLVLLYYVFTLALYRFLRNCAVYNEVREKLQIWYGGHILLHASSDSSAASPMAATSIEQQDGFIDTSEGSNEMHVEQTVP